MTAYVGWKTIDHRYSVGTIEGTQPYRKAKASLKASLCKAKWCSSRGKTVNQPDAPLSLAISIARCRAGETSSLMVHCSILTKLPSSFLDVFFGCDLLHSGLVAVSSRLGQD